MQTCELFSETGAAVSCEIHMNSHVHAQQHAHDNNNMTCTCMHVHVHAHVHVHVQHMHMSCESERKGEISLTNPALDRSAAPASGACARQGSEPFSVSRDSLPAGVVVVRWHGDRDSRITDHAFHISRWNLAGQRPPAPPTAPASPTGCREISTYYKMRCLKVRPAGTACARHRAPPRYTKCACGRTLTDHRSLAARALIQTTTLPVAERIARLGAQILDHLKLARPHSEHLRAA